MDDQMMRRLYARYLLFMLAACGGAFLWQFFLPQLAAGLSAWGTSFGWQREIALWNTGIILSAVIALKKKDLSYMRLLTIQFTVLCWVLGLNHLAAAIENLPSLYPIHLLGVLEVMLLGGVWGSLLLFRTRSRPS